jgi:CRP-like cAMP-binding protein
MRLKKQEGIELLRKVWLFERCTDKELAAIQKIAAPVDVPEGKVLTLEGKFGKEFFVLVSGKAEASFNGIPMRTIEPGSFFGEMALLDRQPRSATITTLEPSTVLVIHAGDFDGLVATMPSVDKKMLSVLAERLRDVEERYVQPDDRIIGPSSS